MALAEASDVIERLGRDLTATEELRVGALLDDASAVVIGYCRDDFEDDEEIPSAVVGVVAKLVARVFDRASGPGGSFVDQQSAGPFSQHMSAASSSGDVWLTAADKIALRRFRKGGGLTSVQLVGERYEITE